ncbi:MAG: hypothetical protein ACI8PZ_003496 [Myxococcota bacterium]|jgi:hypothetical protein
MRFTWAAVTAALLTTACSGEGPVFRNVTKTNVKHVGSRGLTERTFTAREGTTVAECLYTTKGIAADQASDELLPTTYLVEVHDNQGVRSFELYTATNLKGNKGKYFVNNCLHDLILATVPRQMPQRDD